MECFPEIASGFFRTCIRKMVRCVLHLPEQTDASDFKVELIVGKTVEIDMQNRYFFAGRIESETIAGWGFTR